jgi:single-strand DNA-binding protein
MASINKVILLGRLTKDPEVRKTSNGTSRCRFTIACDRKKTKEDQEPGADFISCVAWRQSADFISGYGTKGALVAVEGSIETGSYTDRDGRTVYTTDVLVDRIQLAETKKASRSSEYPNNGIRYTIEDAGRDANQGFDTGDTIEASGDDLPF